MNVLDVSGSVEYSAVLAFVTNSTYHVRKAPYKTKKKEV